LEELHHYFEVGGDTIDIAFDVSCIPNADIPERLSSYTAADHGRVVPLVAINILSKSTWHRDIYQHSEECREVGIRHYVVFSPYHIGGRRLQPPLLRLYSNETQQSVRVVDVHRTYSPSEPETILEIPGTPFRFAAIPREERGQGGISLYRLIVLSNQSESLLTNAEQAQQRAEQAQQRAEQAQQRAERAEETLRQYVARFGPLD
jgi:hypothetical protein